MITVVPVAGYRSDADTGAMAEPDLALEPIGAVYRTAVGREATEPMREDIRLLGAMLGDTVREQSGPEVFDLVERARVEAFRVRRSEVDRAVMVQMFEDVDVHQAIPVIRAFSHFALLANVAEDIHRERRREVHVAAGEAPPDSTLAHLRRTIAGVTGKNVQQNLTAREDRPDQGTERAKAKALRITGRGEHAGLCFADDPECAERCQDHGIALQFLVFCFPFQLLTILSFYR